MDELDCNDDMTEPARAGVDAAPLTGDAGSVVEKEENIAADEATAEDVPDINTIGADAAAAAAAAQDEPSPKRKRAKKIIWNVVLVVLIGLGIYSLFGIVKEFDIGTTSIGDLFKNIDPWYMVALAVSVFGVMLLDTVKFTIINKTITGKFMIGTACKTAFLGRYYDAVTPFSTGGQPMQIIYLNGKGIEGGKSSAIVFIKYFTSIVTWSLLGCGLMIAGTVANVFDKVDPGIASTLKIVGWIGMAINLFIPVFVTLFIIIPKAMYKATHGVVKIGKKLRIVKDVEKTTARATKVVADFKHSFRMMSTSPFSLILLLAVSIGEALITFAIPYLVMLAFKCSGTVTGHFLDISSLNVFTIFGVSFIPTPGNSGFMEFFGGLAFSAAAGAALVWSVLFWRLSVYYIYIIIGIGITVFDIVVKNKKNRALKRDKAKDKP